MNDPFQTRVLQLIDALDQVTQPKQLSLTRLSPQDWGHGNREAWCVGFLEGQRVLSHVVRGCLADFVRETERTAALEGGKAP